MSYGCNDVRCGVVKVLIPHNRRQLHVVIWLQQAGHCHQKLEGGAYLLVNEGLQQLDTVVEWLLRGIRPPIGRRLRIDTR